MSGPVSSAVVSEAVSRITSLLTGKYSEYNNVQEWIDRLVRVRIKFESVVKVSEGFDINIKSLHEWQEKFKEDLCEAEEALSNFQAKILHEKPNRTVEGGSSSHDQLMQEEGSDDATMVHPVSILSETVTRQIDLEANLPRNPFMQEEGSIEATLVHPASNLREAVTRQVDVEANLPHEPFMQEEGSNGATLVQPASNHTETITRHVNQEPHDEPMERGRSFLSYTIYYVIIICDMMANRSKLIATVKKLEKRAGDIGEFLELLKLQSKRKMITRKRKRMCGVGFFLVIFLKLQTYTLFCYGEDPYLLFACCFAQTAMYLLESPVIFSSDSSCEVLGLVSFYFNLDRLASFSIYVIYIYSLK